MAESGRRQPSFGSELDGIARRPSLEYTVGTGDEGRHCIGSDAKESNLETWVPPKSARGNAVPFSVNEGAEEEEHAALHIKPKPTKPELSPMRRSKQSNDLEDQKEQAQFNKQQSDVAGRAALKAAGSECGIVDNNSTQRKLSSSARPKASKRNAATRASAGRRFTRPQLTATPRSSAMSVARRPPTAIISDDDNIRRKSNVLPSRSPGRCVDAHQRMGMKSAHGVLGLRCRVRTNVQTRIAELDERSRTRWSVSARLEYEERLSQGIHVVPRSDKIDWFQEQIHKDDGTEARHAEDKAFEARLRRARCSLACVTLFKEDERTQFVAGKKHSKRKPHGKSKNLS